MATLLWRLGGHECYYCARSAIIVDVQSPKAPIVIIAMLMSCLAAACSTRAVENRGLPTGSLAIGSGTNRVVVQVEIADTDASRHAGLMGRTTLGADSGMVFLFDGPTDSSFWMKDTLIALSIAFWDAVGSIVAVLDMEPCRADPCPQYSPDASYVGAVEVNLGYFAAHGVEVGEHVELDR